jgi:hypothetical protein
VLGQLERSWSCDGSSVLNVSIDATETDATTTNSGEVDVAAAMITG